MADEVNVFDLPDPKQAPTNVFDLPPAPPAPADDRAARLFGLFDEASKEGSDRAGILQIAERAKVPTSLVEAQYPLWRKRFDAAQRDPERFLADNPGLAELVLDNPQVAGVVLKDQALADLEHTLRGKGGKPKAPEAEAAGLKGWERYFGQVGVEEAQAFGKTGEVAPKPGIFQAAYRQAETGVQLAKVGRQLMDRVATGEDTWELEKRVVDLRRDLAPRDYRAGRVEQAIIDAMGILPSQLESMKGAGVGAVAGGVLGAAGGAGLGSLGGGVGAVPGAKVGAGIGVRLGSKAGTFLSTFNLERGGAYLDIRDMRTDEGLPVDEPIARGAAIAYGLAAAGVETASMGPVLKMLGPIGDAIAKGEGKAFMAAMLKDRTFRALMGDVAKRWAKGAAAEATEEAVQDLLQDVAGYWAKTRTAGEDQGQAFAPQEAKVGEALASAMDTWATTFRGSLVLGAAGGAATIVQHAVVSEQAARDYQRVTGLIDAAQASETAQALPGEVAKLAELVTAEDGAPVSAAFVDANAFVELFQSENADPYKAAAELLGPDGAQRLEEAVATGQKLEIPMREYLQTWATKPVAQALAKDTALRPGGLTINELATQDKEIQAQAEKIADSFGAEKEPAAPMSEQEARLDALAKQLEQAGTYTKAEVRRAIHLPRAFVRTMAARMKVDADALFRDIETRVEKATGQAAGGPMQAAPAAPKGRLRIFEEAGKRIHQILLEPKADASTFLHESAHSFWETFSTLAAQADAPESVRRDLAAARKWMGAEEGQAPGVEALEKWARGFEAYLLEGQAPSEELAGAFQRFRFWLMAIYREVKALGVELSPEIRGVFDRLLATDEEIARVRRAMGAEAPLFGSAEDAGLTPQQWQDYLDGREDAFERSAVALARRVTKEKAREAEAWWKAEQARLEEDAATEYETLPAAQARRYVMRSELVKPDGTTVIDPQTGKLDRAAVKAAIGEEDAKRFGTRLVEGGQNPDDVAQLFGFATGEEMLRQVMALPEQGAWAERRAAEVMVARHGDIAAELGRLRDAAKVAAHAAPVGDTLLREFGMLWSKVGAAAGPRPPSKAALQRAARLIAERQGMGRLEPGRALVAERAAAEEAVLRSRQKRWPDALAAKSRQILNHYLWKELESAREDRETLRDTAATLGRDKALARVGKASPALRDGILHVLEATGLREPTLDPKRTSWDAVLTHLGAIGHAVNFDSALVDELLDAPRDWRTLTVEQGRQILGALQSLKQASVNLTKVLVDGKRVDRAEVIAQLVAEASASLRDLGPEQSSEEAKSAGEKLLDIGQGWDATLLQERRMLGWLGGGKGIDSTWFRAIVLPLRHAKQREAQILADAVAPLLKVWEAMPKAVRARLGDKIDGAKLFPTHRENPRAPTRRFELLMMALNWGNDSNRQRLLEGRNISETDAKAAIDLLTKEEMDWVQAVWDAAESLWPMSRELEERDAGMAPPKIEARAIETRWGTYRGGYFPAVYDRRVSRVGEKQAADTLGAILDPTYTTPGTPHSHLKKRATEFADVISLSPGTIVRHLGQVAHDIAFRETLKSVGSLLLDDQVKEAMQRRLGDQRTGQFLPWLKAIGSQRAQEGAEQASKINRLFAWWKANVPIATLGYAVDVALGDLSNLTASLSVKGLSKRHYAAVMLEFAAHPMRLMKEMNEKSAEMRLRDDQTMADLRRMRGDLSKSMGVVRRGIDAYVKHAFDLFEWTDKFTRAPLWTAAYRQAIDAGRPEREAVTFADDTVLKIFPSHNVQDKSGALRDRGLLGSLLLFQGFFNTMYGHERDLVHDLYSVFHEGTETKESLKLLAQRAPGVTFRLLALWISVGAVSELLSGRGPEEGDEGDDEDLVKSRWANWALRKTLLAPLQTIPFLAAPIEAKVMGKRVSERGAPGMALVQSMWKAFEAAADEEPDLARAIEEAARSSGIAFGVPTARPIRAAQYVRRVLQEETEAPRGPGDVASGVIFTGGREGAPENIPSLVQDQVSGER